MAWVGSDTWTGATAWGEHGGGTQEGAANLTSVSSLTAVGQRVREATVAFTTATSLTGQALRTAEASAALTSTSTLTATAAVVAAGANLTSTSTLTATAVRTTFADAVLTSASTLTANAVRTVNATASLIATSSLTAVAEARTAADLTYVGATSWVAGATSVAPTYPSGLLEGDRVFLEVHNKLNTATPSTPANWSLVATATGGGGANGAGTGITRTTLFARTVPAGGLTGTQSVTITSGNVALACMRAWRGQGTSPVFDAETTTSYSKSAASTAGGGTGLANLTLGVKDAVVVIIGPTDDTAVVSAIGVTAAGATFGAVTMSPGSTGTTTTGNDLAAAGAYAIVTAGTSTAAPVVTATLATSETNMGFLYRVSATAVTVSTQQASADLLSTSSLVATGTIIVVQQAAAALTSTSSLVAAGEQYAPTTSAEQSAEPGYAIPGAFWVGSVDTTSAMGGAPTIEAAANLTAASALTATAVRAAEGVAALTAASALTATGTREQFADAQLDVISDLEVEGLVEAFATANLIALSSLTATADEISIGYSDTYSDSYESDIVAPTLFVIRPNLVLA